MKFKNKLKKKKRKFLKKLFNNKLNKTNFLEKFFFDIILFNDLCKFLNNIRFLFENIKNFIKFIENTKKTF